MTQPLSQLPSRKSMFLEMTKNPLTILWYGWFSKLAALLTGSVSATVVTAKITAGGTNGSLTYVNGILVSKVDPT